MDSDPLLDSDLTKFLRKALEIQLDEPESQLTEEDLKRIALRAGLTEEDWNRVCEKLDGHLLRGRNFLAFENFPDATVELDQAAAIAPYRANVLADCGSAHLGLWKETGAKPSRHKAAEMFTKCLEIDPGHSGAAEGLSDLKRSRPPSRKVGKGTIAATVAALACGISAWFALSGPSAEPLLIGTVDEFAGSPEDALEFFKTHNIFGKEDSEKFVNSLGMQFAEVPIYHGDQRVDSLLFSVFETQLKEFRVFVESESFEGRDRVAQNPNKPDYPVVNVSWYEARAFCQWLTSKERAAGTIGPNDRYRLPTDHEWSCAIGIGQMEDPDMAPKYKHNRLRSVFPWGVDWPPPVALGNYPGPETEIPNAAPLSPDGFVGAAPVGSYPLSHWGLHDLGGNVWEWCEDQWDVNMENAKTTRGGAFEGTGENHILSGGRRWIPSQDRKRLIGFRCVLEREEN